MASLTASALAVFADESGKNKNRKFQNRDKGYELRFPIIPLSHRHLDASYVYCPEEFELEYPCKDKSKDTTDFSDWSYFK
jgi:hypothetical protein